MLYFDNKHPLQKNPRNTTQNIDNKQLISALLAAQASAWRLKIPLYLKKTLIHLHALDEIPKKLTNTIVKIVY